MVPTIIPYDRIHYIKISDIKELKYGDIIVFLAGKRNIVHRVIKKTGNGVITKGDNEFFPDPLLQKKDILGKVIAVLRNSHIYDYTTFKAQIYNYYCFVYSYFMYLSFKLVTQIFPKFLFRGRHFLLSFLKKR